MKAEVKIPKGWVRVKEGRIQEGDLILDFYALISNKDPGWFEPEAQIGLRATGDVVIRRVPRKKR